MTEEKPFTWYDFLDLADRITKISFDNIEEAKCRTIISRAYYACYHKALDLLKEKYHFVPSGEHKHKEVLDTLRYYNSSLADEFSNLLDDRTTADYTVEKRIDIKKAKMVVLQSKQVFTAIKEMYKLP
jgi:uncharacterized protein (UPF0332 family)